jgi:hypothetical protein
VARGPQCRHASSRMKPSRTGLIRGRGRIGPDGPTIARRESHRELAASVRGRPCRGSGVAGLCVDIGAA